MASQPRERIARQTFGQRKIVPRVCIVDAKQHIRAFLGIALEELGFVVFECSQRNEVAAALDERKPDLVVIGYSSGALEVCETVNVLAANRFSGSVLLVCIGARNMMHNPNFSKKGIKFLIFSSPIRLNGFYFLVKLPFYKLLEVLKN